MKPCQLEILQHSLGVDKYGQGRRYRNYFCSEEGGDLICESLVSLGYMARFPEMRICCSVHYFVTDSGIKEMTSESPKPPKLSPGQRRYREWLNVSDCFPDWKFGDWLKHPEERWPR